MYLCNRAILYMEDFCILVRSKDLRQVLAVGVGDENLSETFALQETDDVLHACGVEFVEDVIEQENRTGRV